MGGGRGISKGLSLGWNTIMIDCVFKKTELLMKRESGVCSDTTHFYLDEMKERWYRDGDMVAR